MKFRDEMSNFINYLKQDSKETLNEERREISQQILDFQRFWVL